MKVAPRLAKLVDGLGRKHDADIDILGHIRRTMRYSRIATTMTKSTLASASRSSDWLKFGAMFFPRSLEFRYEIEGGIMLPPAVTNRKRQIRVQQVEVDVGPAGGSQGLFFGGTHGRTIGHLVLHRKAESRQCPPIRFARRMGARSVRPTLWVWRAPFYCSALPAFVVAVRRPKFIF